ncbi:MAG: D-alanine--D-alanine ligase family protein [Candidatus Amesbacteria bacterium]|nr:D-alanine--D-alanine ligase family protein [Candidatus Amesbacteria bacterium]
MAKQNIAVFYGGRSVEHEVSVITALQVMHNLDKNKYNVMPIYVTKDGRFIKGNQNFLKPEFYKNLEQISEPQIMLRDGSVNSENFLIKKQEKIDCAILAFHGTYGEDGCVQGLLEMAGIPYTGCGVLASSIGMDKLAQKKLFSDIPQVKLSNNFPLFVKPANGGSSIGITKVKNAKELKDAIEVAKAYDSRVIVEESAEGFMEINISVLGNDDKLITSICEQPIASKEVLTYDDKYKSGSKGMASAKKLIPAPIKPATAAKIAEYAKQAFMAIDGSGMARVDFLVSPDEKTIYINEINTLPGCFAFFLWEKTNLPFPKLLDKLIELGQERFASRNSRITTFSSNILASLGQGLKGGKVKN